MPEFVRVKDKATKHEYSVVASTVDPDHQEVLEKDATNPDGTPLPPKHHISPSSLSSKARKGTNSGQQADSEKESD